MKLVVALDLPTPEENLSLVNLLAEGEKLDVAFKIGLNTFIAGGMSFVEQVKFAPKDDTFETALDLKLYDIPNTMMNAALRVAESGFVDLMTIHASSGQQGMSEITNAFHHIKDAPKVLAVTILTSFTHDHCQNVYGRGRSDATRDLVMESVHAGVDGVVCSAHDLPLVDKWQLQTLEREPLIKFVPGIELKPRDDDQQRKGNLRDVIWGGANYIVVGRPIYQSPNPKQIVFTILDKIRIMEDALRTFRETATWMDEPEDAAPTK